MPATVTAAFGSPDPSVNPTTFSDLVDTLNDLALPENVTGGPFTPYVISSTTPSVSDQDKAWFKTDGNGRPLGIYIYYNGNWRKTYSGNTSELRMFRGDPTTYFDNTGLGIVGGDWDGWAICNGSNGTDNWSDTFPIAGRLDDTPISGYNSGWQTNITGGATKTGGATSYAIINNNLPYMAVTVTGKKYSAGAGNSPKRVLVDGDYGATESTDPNPIAEFGANPSGTPPVAQIPVPTIPPFRAMCLCQFVGYS